MNLLVVIRAEVSPCGQENEWTREEVAPADDIQDSNGLGWEKAATESCSNDLQGLSKTGNSSSGDISGPGSSTSSRVACNSKENKDAIEMMRKRSLM